MLTRYKKSDIKDLILEDYPFYPELSLVCDKARVVYKSLGWNHWDVTAKGQPEEHILNLVKSALVILNKDIVEKKSFPTARVESGGIIVELYLESDGTDEVIDLTVSFNLS